MTKQNIGKPLSKKVRSHVTKACKDLSCSVTALSRLPSGNQTRLENLLYGYGDRIGSARRPLSVIGAHELINWTLHAVFAVRLAMMAAGASWQDALGALGPVQERTRALREKILARQRQRAAMLVPRGQGELFVDELRGRLKRLPRVRGTAQKNMLDALRTLLNEYESHGETNLVRGALADRLGNLTADHFDLLRPLTPAMRYDLQKLKRNVEDAMWDGLLQRWAETECRIPLPTARKTPRSLRRKRA